MSSGDIVKLNIGGTVFQTTESTLTKFDGMFKTMLETDVPVKKDKSGCIFIDRSAKHFDKILNFMREGNVILPKTEEDILEIQNESQYYLLTGLVELCNAKIPIIANPIKPVLLFYYPVFLNASVGYPEGFDVNSFLEKYKNRFDIYFKPYKVARKAFNTDWCWNFYKNHNISGGDTKKASYRPFLETIEIEIDYYLKHGTCAPNHFFENRY